MRFLIAPIAVCVFAFVPRPTWAGDPPSRAAKPRDKSSASELPSEVDLRRELTELGLGPRPQGSRNTCSVFTTTAALEFALAKRLGRASPLSVEYLNWACNQVIGNESADRGQFFHDLLSGFQRYGICTEEQMPYADQFDPALQPSKQATREAKQVFAKKLTVHWINPWKPQAGLTDAQLHQIKAVLAAGWPVAAGSSHSRLLVGYQDDADQEGGGIFHTKDSGSGRFETVTYDFAKTKVGDVFWVGAVVKRSPPTSAKPESR